MAETTMNEAEAETETEAKGEHEQRQNEADRKAEKPGGDTKAAEKPQGEATQAESESAAPETEKVQEPSEADWRALLKDAEAKKQAERFSSLDEVFKSNAEFRKQLSSRIAIPGKNASEEDVAKFRKALGVPEKPEGYELKLPEGVELNEAEEQLVEALKPEAHERNIPAEAFNGFVAKFKEFEAQIVNEHEAALEKQREEAEGELKNEWGKEYKANVNVANRAMKQVGGDEMVEFMNGTELKDGGVLGNHPQMVRLFARLGRQMSEDGVIEPVDSDEAKNLSEQIDQKNAEMVRAYNAGDRTKAAKLDKEIADLSARLHGDTPIVGSGGRAV